jgi:hypothetical protein
VLSSEKLNWLAARGLSQAFLFQLDDAGRYKNQQFVFIVAFRLKFEQPAQHAHLA